MVKQSINSHKKTAKQKRSVGRPGKYDTHVLPRLEEIEQWGESGATDLEIAKKLGISVATLFNYKRDYLEFLEALKRARAVADDIAVGSFFKRVTGFSEVQKIIEREKKDGTKETITEMAVFPPDTPACIFWLKNRRPEEWKEKLNLDHSMSDLPAMLEEAMARVRKSREEGK